MASEQDIEQALREAHNAGDDDIAQRLADELYSIKNSNQEIAQSNQSIADQGGIFGSLTEGATNLYQGAKELITGEQRSTPEIEALPDISQMPITDSIFDILTGLKVGGSTLFADTNETVKILQNNIPNLGVRQDEKGNYILKNPYDNKEYAIKPGFRASDIPKVIGNITAFTPAGRGASFAGRVGGSMATQAGIEAGQLLSGGELNPEDIALAGATQAGGELVSRGITALSPTSKLAGEIIDETSDIPMQKLIANAKLAGKGGGFTGGSERIVREAVKPSQDILESAKRLGIEDYLQPDHVSTNQNFKELSAGIRSFPATEARRLEQEGLLKVSQRANDIIEELGGTNDFSSLDVNIKNSLQQTQDDLLKKSEMMYSNLNKKISNTDRAPADNVLGFINKRIKDLGGFDGLSPIEKRIYSNLKPKEIKSQTELSSLDYALGKRLKEITEIKYPTYARLDNIRKDLTIARIKKEGVFKDADSGLLKKLENLTLEDQKNFVEKAGYLDEFNLARQTVAQRKAIENDLTAIYGKNLDKSIVKPLILGITNLSKGDVSNFINLIKRIPEDLRKSVTVSGLSNVFSKTGRDGQLNFGNYVQFYENLSKNSQAKNALFLNLPTEAKQTLDDFYKVAKGIYTSKKEAITTGRIGVVQDELANADNLIGKIYNVATALPKVAISEGVSSALGLPGAGLTASLVASLNAGKTEAIKQADALISSPVFIKNAKLGTPEAIEEIAKSSPFNKFMRSIGRKQTINKNIQFITNALQMSKEANNDNTD